MYIFCLIIIIIIYNFPLYYIMKLSVLEGCFKIFGMTTKYLTRLSIRLLVMWHGSKVPSSQTKTFQESIKDYQKFHNAFGVHSKKV